MLQSRHRLAHGNSSVVKNTCSINVYEIHFLATAIPPCFVVSTAIKEAVEDYGKAVSTTDIP